MSGQSSKEPSNEGSQKSSNASATASKVTTTSLNDDWTSLFGMKEKETKMFSYKHLIVICRC